MKIYHLRRTDAYPEWDYWTEFVCFAPSEEVALKIHPSGTDKDPLDPEDWDKDVWPSDPDLIIVNDLGIAHDDQKEGVICGSYMRG